jgi:HK97 gp10 family phage protein
MANSSVTGTQELLSKLKGLGLAVSEENLTKALMAGGYVLEGAIKIDMAQPKTGRMYGNHQASAPGESPAMDTSLLANSIMTEADDDGVYVGTNSEYAEPLEFGTARMAARPFMTPAVEANREAIAEAAQAVLKKAIDEAAKNV